MDSGFRLIPGFRDCQDPGNNTGHGAVDLGPKPPHVQIVRLAQMIHQSWGGPGTRLTPGFSPLSPLLPSSFLPSSSLPSSLPPFLLFLSTCSVRGDVKRQTGKNFPTVMVAVQSHTESSTRTSSNVKIYLTSFAVVALGTAVALLILSLELIEKKLLSLGDFRDAYTSASGCSLVYFLTMRVMSKRAQIKRREADVYRMNQHIYAVYDGENKTNPVYMVSDGKEGEFNRAQRAVFNFQENHDQSLFQLVLVAIVLPEIAFVYSILIGICFIWFSIGYSKSTSGRVPGFVSGVILRYSILLFMVGIIVKSLTM